MTTQPSERLHCPTCRCTLADNGRPHCGEDLACRWLICAKCGSVYDTTSGNHYRGTARRNGGTP